MKTKNLLSFFNSSRPSSFDRPSSAFTLVELLVAVAVLAVGMVFVLGALSRLVTSVSIAEQMVEATYRFNEKSWDLKERQMDEGGLAIGESEGEFEERTMPMRWHVTIDEISADFKDESLVVSEAFYEATSTIAWGAGRRQRQIEAVVYVKRLQE